MAQTSGKISEGTIVEIVDDNFDYVNIEFPDGQLPEINDALVSEYIASDGQKIRVRFIVEQILDEYTVRAFTMSYADGLTEGMKVVDARELVNKEEKTKEQKDRVWSNLFVGIILMAIGLVYIYYGGFESIFTCERTSNICRMETRQFFSETKEKEYEIELSSIEKAIVEKYNSVEHRNISKYSSSSSRNPINKGIVYKPYLVTKDKNRPLSKFESNSYSASEEKANKFNNYLNSYDEKFELVDNSRNIGILSGALLCIGFLLLLGSLIKIAFPYVLCLIKKDKYIV